MHSRLSAIIGQSLLNRKFADNTFQGVFSLGHSLFAKALGRLVGINLTVADVDDAMGVLGDVGLVGDGDTTVFPLACRVSKRAMDLDAGLGVEVTGGLVGQDDGRAVHKRAGNGDALALAPGELVGLVVHARLQTHIDKRFLSAFNARGCRCAVVDERKFDVVQRSCAGKQVEGLENESDFLVTNARQFIVIEFADELAC